MTPSSLWGFSPERRFDRGEVGVVALGEVLEEVPDRRRGGQLVGDDDVGAPGLGGGDVRAAELLHRDVPPDHLLHDARRGDVYARDLLDHDE
jgi:hypothetical protein